MTLTESYFLKQKCQGIYFLKWCILDKLCKLTHQYKLQSCSRKCNLKPIEPFKRTLLKWKPLKILFLKMVISDKGCKRYKQHVIHHCSLKCNYNLFLTLPNPNWPFLSKNAREYVFLSDVFWIRYVRSITSMSFNLVLRSVIKNLLNPPKEPFLNRNP